MFYAYKLIFLVISILAVLCAWGITHYLIKEIDKIHYVKGYKDSLKYPRKLIYYFAQLLIFAGLAVIPMFLAGQRVGSKRSRKKDRLLAYNLYIIPLIGIWGYNLIIKLFSQIAYYYDLEILSKQITDIAGWTLYFLVPYYIILGVKGLYRLSRNRTIQIEKRGYRKEEGIKKSDYEWMLFKDKAEEETDEEFEQRINELDENWFYIYDSEEEWKQSKEVQNNHFRMNKVFAYLLVIFSAINFMLLIGSYEILEREIVTVNQYNAQVFPIKLYVYYGELAIIAVFMINYLIGRMFKVKKRLLWKNMLSILNILMFVVVFGYVDYSQNNYGMISFGNPLSEEARTIKNPDTWEEHVVPVNGKTITQIKNNYVKRVKHERNYESFTKYEKTNNVMKHPRKYKNSIEAVGKDNVEDMRYGIYIVFQSNNALDKRERDLYMQEPGYFDASFSDGLKSQDTYTDISIYFGSEPQLCVDEEDGSVNIQNPIGYEYKNDNLCGLEHDIVNTVEDLYSKAFDYKKFGNKS